MRIAYEDRLHADTYTKQAGAAPNIPTFTALLCACFQCEAPARSPQVNSTYYLLLLTTTYYYYLLLSTYYYLLLTAYYLLLAQ